MMLSAKFELLRVDRVRLASQVHDELLVLGRRRIVRRLRQHELILTITGCRRISGGRRFAVSGVVIVIATRCAEDEHRRGNQGGK